MVKIKRPKKPSTDDRLFRLETDFIAVTNTLAMFGTRIKTLEEAVFDLESAKMKITLERVK